MNKSLRLPIRCMLVLYFLLDFSNTPAWANSSYQVNIPVNKTNLVCRPEVGFGSDCYVYLELFWPEMNNYTQLNHTGSLMLRVSSEIKENHMLECERIRRILINEAEKTNGVITRTLNVQFIPEEYNFYPLTDKCLKQQSEFLSVFMGYETPFGNIGPEMSRSLSITSAEVPKEKCYIEYPQ